MYNYFFDSSITTQGANELVDRIQDKEKVKLYFQTYGGEIDAMMYLIDVFNSMEDNLEIVINGRICSAGTQILVKFKGKITLGTGLDYFLFHNIDREGYNLRKNDVSHKKLTALAEEENKEFAKLLEEKEILNKAQIKKFLRGENVVLYRDEIIKLKMFNETK